MVWFIIGVIVGLYLGIIPAYCIVNNMHKEKESKAADVCEGYCKECSVQVRCIERRNSIG